MNATESAGSESAQRSGRKTKRVKICETRGQREDHNQARKRVCQEQLPPQHNQGLLPLPWTLPSKYGSRDQIPLSLNLMDAEKDQGMENFLPDLMLSEWH